MSSQSRPDRERAGNTKLKIRPISNRVEAEKGLPVNVDAERFVLGSVLLDDTRFREVQVLSHDFSLERHRRIFKRMQDLQARGEHIDRVTVAEELARHNELGYDGFSCLVSLDDGMPYVSHLASYVRIVRDKSSRRRAIFAAHKLIDDSVLETTEPDEMLAGHIAQIEVLRGTCSDRRKIERVEDLESIFAKRAPVKYLVEPELPEKQLFALRAIRRVAKAPWLVAGRGMFSAAVTRH